MIIHLLDYISRDYVAAVEDGQIINAAEFQEMKEFSKAVLELILSLDREYQLNKEFLDQVLSLKTFIQEKESSIKVAELAQKLKRELIIITGYKVAPLQWPNRTNGKRLYAKNCMACHGNNGDGQGDIGLTMDPAPTNFQGERMTNVSPFQAFNIIRLGINGTAMRAFPEIGDQETWDLAFYIKSIRFEEKDGYFNQNQQLPKEVNITEVASLGDAGLMQQLEGNREEAKQKLTFLRLYVPAQREYNSLLLAEENLNASLAAYKDGNASLARNKALAAYLEGIEPVEAQLQANDPSLTIQLEQQMFQLRASIEELDPVEVVQKEIKASLALVAEAKILIQDGELSFLLSFLLSLSILLREGLEAFLIIAVVLALIRTTGIKRAIPWLHGGWIAAILLGFVGWHMSDILVKVSGRDREIMEGIIALFAVLVLVYVGFWLHSHSHAKRWHYFIEHRVKHLLRTENMWGLAVFSFMVVFRETLESVLFLQAIKLETAPEDQSAITLGVIVATVIITIVVMLFVKYSKKIPLRQFFRYSSWMITLLAIILMGKGIHAIQESGYFSATGIPVQLRVEWLGIYPTLESISGQIFLLVIIFSLWYINERRNK